MQYVCLDRKGKVLGLVANNPYSYGLINKDAVPKGTHKAKANWDFESFEEVEAIAEMLTTLTKAQWIAYDEGPSHSPRFGIMEMFKAGDEISYGYNGDSNPCCTVIRITPTLVVVGSDGERFRRRGSTSTWRREGSRGWTLSKGHHSSRNPSY
jgi:hypothetical protein